MGRECLAVAAGEAELVSFPTHTAAGKSVPVEGIFMKPGGDGPFPAVVVLHGGPGIFAPYCYRMAQEMLVGWGYSALVVDSYSAGFPEAGRNHAPTIEDRTRDAWAAAIYLASRPDVRVDRIGVVGWSLGGLGMLLAISDNVSSTRGKAPTFKAAAAFYAECVSRLLGLRTPVLLLHGEADLTNPVEDCKNMRVVGGDASYVDIVTYPGVGHTFDFPGSADYDPASAQDALNRMQEHFRKYLH